MRVVRPTARTSHAKPSQPIGLHIDPRPFEGLLNARYYLPGNDGPRTAIQLSVDEGRVSEEAIRDILDFVDRRMALESVGTPRLTVSSGGLQ